MFIPWWGIGLVAVVLVYLVVMVMQLHKRVHRLEKMLRNLEGVSEDDLKKQIRDTMLQNNDGRK